jgi:hypothetical protein
LARPLAEKGLGAISNFWPITSEDFKTHTQRIGPASRCKAALHIITSNHLIALIRQAEAASFHFLPSFFLSRWNPFSVRVYKISLPYWNASGWYLSMSKYIQNHVDCMLACAIATCYLHILLLGAAPIMSMKMTSRFRGIGCDQMQGRQYVLPYELWGLSERG